MLIGQGNLIVHRQGTSDVIRVSIAVSRPPCTIGQMNISHGNMLYVRSSNELPFNEEQNDPNLESVANMVTKLWLFSKGMSDDRVVTFIDWHEASF